MNMKVINNYCLWAKIITLILSTPISAMDSPTVVEDSEPAGAFWNLYNTGGGYGHGGGGGGYGSGYG
jgi:hypothetical protein